jgi:hypothetical protein
MEETTLRPAIFIMIAVVGFVSLANAAPRPQILSDLSDPAADMFANLASANCRTSAADDWPVWSWNLSKTPDDPEKFQRANALIQSFLTKFGSLEGMCNELYLKKVISQPFKR